MEFRFRNERGGWKLDLIPTMQAVSIQLDNLAEELGKTRVEWVLTLLGNVTGKEIDDSVWELPVALP